MNMRIFCYWLVVAIPLSWGVAQSVNSALPLFGGKSVYIPWVLGVPPVAAAPKPVITDVPTPPPVAKPDAAVTATPASENATATPAS